MPTLRLVPPCHDLRFLQYLQGQELHHLPGQHIRCLTTRSMKKFFLMPSLNLLWHNSRPFSLMPSLEKRDKQPLTAASFEVAVVNKEASPQPPLQTAPVPSTSPHNSFSSLFTSSLTLLCTFLINSLSLLQWGTPTNHGVWGTWA